MSPFRPRASLKRLVAVALLLSLGLGDLRHAATVPAGSPPDPPVITSPLASDVGADDVHMEMGAPFRDPDGDAHAATDWEIRTERRRRSSSGPPTTPRSSSTPTSPTGPSRGRWPASGG